MDLVDGTHLRPAQKVVVVWNDEAFCVFDAVESKTNRLTYNLYGIVPSETNGCAMMLLERQKEKSKARGRRSYGSFD